MGRVDDFSISSVCLRTDDYPGPRPCCACLYALVPRVLESRLTSSTSAVSEPGTAARATTAFPRFRDSGACMACCTDGRRRSFWCVLCGNWSKTETTKPLQQPSIHITPSHEPRTYVCRHPRPQTTCDLRFRSQHFRSSCTKRRQERSS